MINSFKSILHKAESRGYANHGWLKSFHTFSFANYFNPDRVNFGTLRVLNDDEVAPGEGFGTHPHDNMEIISIPLEGALAHRDSMGNEEVIYNGDIQVMSAGTGIRHSEYNYSDSEKVKFLQIWVFPNKRDVTPRYDQITLNTEDRHNKFQTIIDPTPKEGCLWIHQDAWFSLGKFQAEIKTTYKINKENNGVYIFVLNGKVEVNGTMLEKRDGFGIWDTDSIDFRTLTNDTEILLMEVPMQLS